MRANIAGLDPNVPDQILVTLNARDRRYFDVYRLTLSTGALVLDTQNPGDVDSWYADRNLNVVAAVAVSPKDASTEIRVRDNPQSPWRAIMKAPYDENVGVNTVSADGKSLIIESSLGTDTARVIEKNIATGAEKVIASSPEVDAGIVMINPLTKVVEAVSFDPGRRQWTVVDPSVKPISKGSPAR